MTPRENYLNYFHGKPFEWVPNDNDQQVVMPSIISENVARAFVFEEKPFDMDKVGGKGWFGIEWEYVPTVGGSIEKEGQEFFEDFNDWEKFVKFPNLDEIDWEGYAKEHYDYLHTDLINYTAIFTSYFERMISFAGFTNAVLALIDDDQKEAIHRLFDKLTDFYIDYAQRMHKYFNVEYFEVHDDWGNQRSIMFSRETHTEMILPYVTRLVKAIHDMGCLYEQHSCGAIADMVPNIIASGADTWTGQTNAIDKKALVEKYGDQFIFNVYVQINEPSGDDVIDQVIDKFLADFNGKKITYCFGRFWTPEQRAHGQERIRKEFKLNN